MTVPAYDLAPALELLMVGAAVAALPLAWWTWRHRRAEPGARLRALTALTLFLTFDLVVFGAFTRLTDSGLGCPDWPGCYGEASPLGAHADISAAQSAQPFGPVTHGKAWVEMVHRYLASGVGALIIVLLVSSLIARRRGLPTALPGWAALSLVWVCVQGAFGALTVTMKLYPAIVTAHLLGGMVLLVLLAVQWSRQQPPAGAVARSPLLRRAAWAVAGVLAVQIALGGWVSTNYAVLACSDFPTCQGQWWPPADFAQGFELQRELGRAGSGDYLPFPALTAIHLAHRGFAVAAALALLALAAGLAAHARRHADPTARRDARLLVALVAWQWLSGLSNVVLGWPLVAALGHTAGAAALVVVMTRIVATAARAGAPQSSTVSAPGGARRAAPARLHHV